MFNSLHLVHTEEEDKLLCEAWMEIGQDPICCVKQKGGVYWKRVHDYFHEHRKFEPHKFESDRHELSIQKRWGFTLAECNKFCGSYEHVKGRPMSGIGVKELVYFVPFYI